MNLEQLSARQGAQVRNLAARGFRELSRGLIRQYDFLNTDQERRKFYSAHETTLKHCGGLLGVCMQSAKPLSSRARLEFKAMVGEGTMPRWAFESLTPGDRIAFVQAGGKLS